MPRDPIVDEVRAVREAFAKEHGYDIKAIVRALRSEEAQRTKARVIPAEASPPKRRTPQGGLNGEYRVSGGTRSFALSAARTAVLGYPALSSPLRRSV